MLICLALACGSKHISNRSCSLVSCAMQHAKRYEKRSRRRKEEEGEEEEHDKDEEEPV
jgi:hypothetical protein